MSLAAFNKVVGMARSEKDVVLHVRAYLAKTSKAKDQSNCVRSPHFID
jgi:hypothetical protein